MLELKIGSNEIVVDGTPKTMDVAPFTQDDRTFVPVRFVAENLGYNVDWNEATETVTIDGYRYFNSANEAALDWAMRYNNMSIGLHKELGSTIYKGDKGYYYTPPNIGGSNNVFNSSLPDFDAPKWRVAIIHSHASTGCGAYMGDKISSGDINTAKQIKKDCYMASPCGTLQVYRYGTKKTELISDLLPFDQNAIDKLQGSWKYGDMTKNYNYFNNYNVGTTSVEADFYNKLFAEKRKFPMFND